MTGVVVGLLAGVGVLLAVRAVHAPAPVLARDLARLGRVTPAARTEVSVAAVFERIAGMTLVKDLLAPLNADLEVVGRGRPDFVAMLVARAGAGFGAGLVFGVGFSVVQLAQLRLGPGLVPGVVIAIVGVVSGVFELRANAKRRRAEFLAAITAYIDFVRLGVSFRAIGGAMATAAATGSGWPFRILEQSLADAERRGEDPWVGLGRLGRIYEIADLEELAATLSYGAADGAQIVKALDARSRSLRVRELAADLSKARSATAQLQAPLALLGVGIFLLLLYPAVAVIGGS